MVLAAELDRGTDNEPELPKGLVYNAGKGMVNKSNVFKIFVLLRASGLSRAGFAKGM